MKTIITTAFLLIVLISNNSFAQKSYNTGIGLRGGGASGLTIKHFIADNAALEGIIGGWYRGGGLKIGLLYEIHANAFEVEGLNWYYGGGGHVGLYNNNLYYGGTVVGIDGVLGLEYKIPPIPITLSADLIPFIQTGSGYNFGIDGGIAIRFVF